MFGDDRRRDALWQVDPPKPVTVRLSVVWPPEQLRWANSTPAWVRAGGLNIGAVVPGLLHAWALTSVGRWWPWVRFTVTSINGELTLEVDQLVPLEAVRPIPCDRESPSRR